jgi:hypothetical protein
MTHQHRFTGATDRVLDCPERCRDDFPRDRIETMLCFSQVTPVAGDNACSDTGQYCTCNQT